MENRQDEQERRADEERPLPPDLERALRADPYLPPSAYGQGDYYSERGGHDIFGTQPVNHGMETDAEIMENVRRTLDELPRVVSSGIDIEVINGEVTLHGKVPSQDAKADAERAVRALQGVSTVHNLLGLEGTQRTG
jgi:osmotically-inducible protein OsmY